MSRLAASAALALFAASWLTGCGVATPAASPRLTAPPITPMTGLSPQVDAAAAAVDRQLAGLGLRLVQSAGDYRPSEPDSLQNVPRAVFRVSLADPDAGWVVIYDLARPDAADEAGRLFARHLGSGFGQTNYPRDAQFTLNQVGGALVLAWWSPEQAADPERASAASAALSLAGQAIPIVR